MPLSAVKKIALPILLLFLLLFIWISGQSNWHLGRNEHNRLPQGRLRYVSPHQYRDKAGKIWEVQPAIKNLFHQPDQAAEPVGAPYPIADGTLPFDPQYPNLKLLCRTANGGSCEAILQPDGRYLTRGRKQGTYNYSHPTGIWGNMMHIVWDVIPHFVNSAYRDPER